MLNTERLGYKLVEKGYITEENLLFSLEIQKNNESKILGDILVEQGFIDKVTLIKSAALDFHIPNAINILKKHGRCTKKLESLLDFDQKNKENNNLSINIPSINYQKINSSNTQEEKIILNSINLINKAKFQKALYYLLDNLSDFNASDKLIYLLTWLYVKENLTLDAEALNRQLYSNYKKDIDILNLLVFSNINSKNYNVAIDYLKILMDIEKRDIFYFYMGYCLSETNQKESSVKFYKKFISLSKDKELINYSLQEISKFYQ